MWTSKGWIYKTVWWLETCGPELMEVESELPASILHSDNKEIQMSSLPSLIRMWRFLMMIQRGVEKEVISLNYTLTYMWWSNRLHYTWIIETKEYFIIKGWAIYCGISISFKVLTILDIQYLKYVFLFAVKCRLIKWFSYIH